MLVENNEKFRHSDANKVCKCIYLIMSHYNNASVVKITKSLQAGNLSVESHLSSPYV